MLCKNKRSGKKKEKVNKLLRRKRKPQKKENMNITSIIAVVFCAVVASVTMFKSDKEKPVNCNM